MGQLRQDDDELGEGHVLAHAPAVCLQVVIKLAAGIGLRTVRARSWIYSVFKRDILCKLAEAVASLFVLSSYPSLVMSVQNYSSPQDCLNLSIQNQQ